MLLEEWAADEGKETHPEEIYKGLDTKRKEILLSKIAHDAFQQNRHFLTRREIANQIEDLLKEMLPDEKSIDGAAVLRSIEVQHGILVERTEGIYSFSHLTLQEYLTAQYIDDHRQIESLVVEHLTDQRWQEIFILVAGLMRGGADDLLLRIAKEAQAFSNIGRVRYLIQWANQITSGSEEKTESLTKQAAAILFTPTPKPNFFNLLFDKKVVVVTNKLFNGRVLKDGRTIAVDLNLDYAIAMAYAFEEIKIFKDINLSSLIAQLKTLQAQVPSDEQPYNIHRAFKDKLLIIWCDALKLDQELIMLSKIEADALTIYLYINDLMIQCKEAAVRVSPQVWAGIEERMLTVRNEG